MRVYALTMAASEITLYSQHGVLFTPDIVFDGKTLEFVPNKDRCMLVGVEFMPGLYSVELCRVGDAITVNNLPARVDLDCVFVAE